jgi:hypothetical protein
VLTAIFGAAVGDGIATKAGGSGFSHLLAFSKAPRA